MLIKTNFAAAIFAISILAACATTDDTQTVTKTYKSNIAEAPARTKLSEDSGDKKVCKRTATTGSRFKTKLCMTADQWEQARENAIKSTGEFQRQGAQAGNPKGG